GALQLFDHCQSSVTESEIQFVYAFTRSDGDMLFLLGTIQHDFPFPVVQLVPGHIGAYPEFASDLWLDVEPEHLPRDNRPVLDGHVLVADQSVVIDLTHGTVPLAGGTGASRIECQVFGAGGIKVHATLRTSDLLFSGHGQGGLLPVPIGTNVTTQARKHEPYDIEQFGGGPKRRAHTRYAGSLT